MHVREEHGVLAEPSHRETLAKCEARDANRAKTVATAGFALDQARRFGP